MASPCPSPSSAAGARLRCLLSLTFLPRQPSRPREQPLRRARHPRSAGLCLLISRSWKPNQQGLRAASCQVVCSRDRRVTLVSKAFSANSPRGALEPKQLPHEIKSLTSCKPFCLQVNPLLRHPSSSSSSSSLSSSSRGLRGRPNRRRYTRASRCS